MDTRTTRRYPRTILNAEMRTKMVHDRATHGNNGKQVVDESENSRKQDEEYQDNVDDGTALISYVPRHLRARVARRLHQQIKKKELPLMFVGKKMNESFDYLTPLNGFKLIPTLRVDYTSLQALGLASDVEWMLNGLGLSAFLGSTRQEIYEEETRQFLATVTLAFPRTQAPLARDGVLYFKINGESHSISILELGKALGFEYQDAIEFGPEDANAIWQRFGRYTFESGKTKASSLSHPAIRCTHKLLANNIFSRTAQNNVISDELNVLSIPFVEFPRRINYAALLAKRLVKIKHDAVKSSDKQACISFGGVITTILETAGVNLANRPYTSKDNHMDLEKLGKMRILEGASINPDQFGYKFHIPPSMIRTILLPCPTMPRLSDGLTSWSPLPHEFYSSRVEDRLPLTLGVFIKKKAMASFASQRVTQVSTSDTATSSLEDERARRMELEQELEAQRILIAQLQRRT